VAVNLEFNTYEDIIAFLYNEKRMLFIETLNEIEECLKNGDEVANVANFLIGENTVVINVDKEDWESHLDVSLIYFEGIEDYEICLEIKRLLNSL
jgi:hypothetical protein